MISGLDLIVSHVVFPCQCHLNGNCVLKCMLRRFAISISFMHIVALIFKAEID